MNRVIEVGRPNPLLDNHSGGVDFENQLRPRQRHHLHHGAGGKVVAEELAPGLVDIAVVAHVRGENAERDDIAQRATSRFDAQLDLAQDKSRLRPRIANADHRTIMIRSRLPSDKHHAPRLRDIDERITPPRYRQAVGIERGLGHNTFLLRIIRCCAKSYCNSAACGRGGNRGQRTT